ncbi:hypothetical protein CU098_009853 [Rhizopus stolonifer]|uniref:DUF8032 domain-containing protein n=1 Tax=Rhizopus stolonifer TaxID=4846 RepID=A0A367KNB3_RHIST|nr:hypothetical protein CU098_009853 [Rhizopus stolonifer]
MSLSPTTLLLQDLISAPNKAESILEGLTADQIVMIENTISRVKRRKMDKQPKEENSSATVIANALAAAMVSAALQASHSTTKNNASGTVAPSKTVTAPVNAPVTSNEPIAEIKDGIEWVSFVYSHNRTLKRYSIRTDIQTVALDVVDDKFKADNCVYPRANLPKETYKGNRWSYETECNDLGWKLAWLNQSEIAGKRGLIQRAVDSYRNRYPNMRSRRVARQEKLLNGTLRKRKNRDDEDETSNSTSVAPTPVTATSTAPQPFPTSLEAAIVKPAHQPKTIAIDDPINNTRYRIKINIEAVSLDEIPDEFRKQNCAFPKAVSVDPEHYVGGRTRWLEDSMINELGWKLAYLNPRVLSGKKNFLQRALDVYRTKFMPLLHPRKNSSRTPTNRMITTPTDTIEQDQLLKIMPPSITPCLDFGSCFSLDDKAPKMKIALNSSPLSDLPCKANQDPMISPSYDTMYSDARLSPFDESNSHSSSSANSVVCTPSPPATAGIFGFADSDLYDSFMLPPVNDSFMLLDNNDMKPYDPLMSPSLPSTAASQDLIKLEEDFHDNFNNASHLLDPLF